MVVVLVNFNHSNSSCDFLTHLATLRLNSGKFSRHSLAASTFAGDLRREEKKYIIFHSYKIWKSPPSYVRISLSIDHEIVRCEKVGSRSCRVLRTVKDLKTPANQSSWKNCSWCQIGRTNFKNGPHIFLYIYLCCPFFSQKMNKLFVNSFLPSTI